MTKPPATLPKNAKTLEKVATSKVLRSPVYEALSIHNIPGHTVEAVRPSKLTHVSKLFNLNYNGSDYERPNESSVSSSDDEETGTNFEQKINKRGGKKSIKRRKVGKKSYKKRKNGSRRKRSTRRR